MDNQIEEMSKVIEEAMQKARRTLGGYNNIAMFYAEILYNSNYRKIEKGTVIELPCKVGDTVYVIIKAENGYALLKDICDVFIIQDGEVYIGLQNYNVGANKYYFTREEAEKRLKELQNGRS